MKLLLPLLALAAAPLCRADEKSAAGYGLQFLPAKLQGAAAEATTDEALTARQQNEKFGGLRKDGEETKGYDLASHSTFLQFGNQYTLVPKGSVLHVPEKFASSIVTAPTGSFVPWNEFQTAHRASISRFDVTVDQASGKTPLDADKLEIAKRSGCLLVAVYQAGAISVVTSTPSR